MSTSRKAIAWFEERLNLTEIFSFFTTFGLSYGAIDLSKPVREASREAFSRELPAYTRGPYVFGVLAFLLFVFQGITGLLLAFYYQPSPQSAYESTLLIIREVDFGWYVHQMHYWGSNFLVVLLGVRLVRFFVHGVYKAPRELFWVFGVILFFLATHAAITGALLPWDQQSYWSVTRGLEVFDALPVFGWLLSFLVGGLEVSSATLTRFYVLHIIIIPLTMALFFYLHFATVRRVGLSQLQSEKKGETKALYPDHVFRLGTLFLLIFGVILTLGAVFPSPFESKADPFTSPSGIRPPWFLLPAHSLLELLPHWFAGVLLLLGSVGLVLFPFIERAPYQELKKRPLLAGAAVVVCLLIVGLTIVGYTRGG
jgi:quinol-cytochrome oxidoreductase complex cytochrome b subunit